MILAVSHAAGLRDYILVLTCTLRTTSHEPSILLSVDAKLRKLNLSSSKSGRGTADNAVLKLTDVYRDYNVCS